MSFILILLPPQQASHGKSVTFHLQVFYVVKMLLQLCWGKRAHVG